uniref:Uncharacterized protein n=1 Tax=Panagrolaimus sp. JU765 TaxID=591449 RepID=A0AC34RIH8_9BILA
MNFGSPLQQAFQNRVVTLVDSSFYKIQEAFVAACKSYTRLEVLQELIRFYYSKEMAHSCKAAERIILDFCIFFLTNFKVLRPESYGILDNDFDGLCLRFLCLCYFESERFFDLNFPKISPAEKYFIGSLISHDEGQRQLMIMDNTPRKFASEGDIDYYNLYILWLVRSTKSISMPEVLKNVMVMIDRELILKRQRMIRFEALTRRQKINPDDLKLQELTSDYASASHSESSYTSTTDDRQGATSSESVSANWDNYDPEQILDGLFKGRALRHDEMDFLKLFFEKSYNYTILSNITISDDAMIHVALESPHLCGAILAFLIASKDPRAFHFFNGPLCQTEAVQFVVIIRTFVECWNRNISMAKEFVGNAVTACLNYLNNAISSKAYNSDDSKCIRLIMSYINILVAYTPDTIADRFEELLNILPNFNHVASANTAYNRIISHRTRLNQRP